jgi:excisionase family DNA binding protein
LSLKRSAAAFAARLPDGGAAGEPRGAAGVPSGEPRAAGRLLTVQQAAGILQVRPRELVRFIRQRGLRAVHLGRKLSWRIDERDLWGWVDAQKARRP